MSSDKAKKNPPLFAVPDREESVSDAASPASHGRESQGAPQVCPLCFGTGYEVVPGRGARRCECRLKDTQAKLYAAARIPKRYADCTLQNYRPDTYQPEQSRGSQFRALLKAKDLANNYHDSYRNQGRGLLFMGPVGVGKTHLAVAILRSLIEVGVECLFYESGSLLKTIQDSYNSISRTSELGVLAPVYEAEVLVLDELGATMPTDWVRDTVAQIINKRYNDKKVTIFTTNYLDEVVGIGESSNSRNNPILEKLQNEITALRALTPRNESEKQVLERRVNEKILYEKQILSEITPEHRIQKLTKLEDRIGISMRSRLYEMCETVVIEGADFRRRPRRNDL